MSRKKKFPYKFCLITDFRFIPEEKLESIIRQAILGGVDLVQYRDRNSPDLLRIQRAKRLRKVTADYGAALFINSSVELLLEVNAEGIQSQANSISLNGLRQKIGADKWLGVSVHSDEEILEAEKNDADMLLLSPLFKPGSKSGCPLFLGEEKFLQLRKKTNLPVFALGGITAENAHVPFALGAHGIACVTSILDSDNIQESAAQIIKKIIFSQICPISAAPPSIK